MSLGLMSACFSFVLGIIIHILAFTLVSVSLWTFHHISDSRPHVDVALLHSIAVVMFLIFYSCAPSMFIWGIAEEHMGISTIHIIHLTIPSLIMHIYGWCFWTVGGEIQRWINVPFQPSFLNVTAHTLYMDIRSTSTIIILGMYIILMLY